MNIVSEELSLKKKKSNPKKMQEVSRQEMQRFVNFSYKEHIFEEYYHSRPYQKAKYFFPKFKKLIKMNSSQLAFPTETLLFASQI